MSNASAQLTSSLSPLILHLLPEKVRATTRSRSILIT